MAVLNSLQCAFRGHDILGGLEYRLEVERTVNGQRLGRRAVPHEHQCLETFTDFSEDLALVDVGVVNGRVRNWTVPGG